MASTHNSFTAAERDVTLSVIMSIYSTASRTNADHVVERPVVDTMLEINYSRWILSSRKAFYKLFGASIQYLFAGFEPKIHGFRFSIHHQEGTHAAGVKAPARSLLR